MKVREVQHPAHIVPLAFLITILIGTALLMLPVSRADAVGAPWIAALFTAVSAVCVTGLVTVDTGTYWSSFGQWVIMALLQIGGFGMMTLGIGDVSSVAKLVLFVTVIVEVMTALALALRLHLGYDLPLAEAAWSGLFHSVSAFNNAGFSIHADGLIRYASDSYVLAPVMLAIVIGGLGFPVLQDLRNKLRDPQHWSVHTKLTLVGTAVLLAGGAILLLAFEWANPRTLGSMPAGDKLLSAIFASVSARTAGFNSIDIGGLTHESLGLHYFLMFIGGGSAGTAGGVKVGTAMILVMLVIAEIRGRMDTEAFGRRISHSAQRQAITVLVLSSAVVVLGTVFILHTTEIATDRVIFEVISAFATVGLSTGITADLPDSAQLMLILLMYIGRVGTITLAASLALGEHRMPFRYPEEHPVVG